MSIQRLPVFLSAAKHLNFTKAAEELRISQTAVSQQIKLLEQELDFRLFDRENRGVTLTPAGETFYRRCRQMMMEYQSAVAVGQQVAMGQPDTLRLGYASAYELWSISDPVRRYWQAHPDRHIEFEAGNDQTIIDLLGEGKLDAAVISWAGGQIPEWIASRVLVEEPCTLMLSASHPLAAQKEIDRRDLQGVPLVMNRGQNYRSSEESIAGMYNYLGLGDNPKLYANEFYSLALIVMLGLAVTVAPVGLKNMRLPGLAFVPIRGFQPVTRTRILYPRNHMAPAVRDLLDSL